MAIKKEDFAPHFLNQMGMKILRNIASRHPMRDNDEAEPLPEMKNWLENNRHIRSMDDLWIHIVQCEADKEKGIASVFVNAVELISGTRSDCEHETTFRKINAGKNFIQS
jgi:hypothetical protein